MKTIEFKIEETRRLKNSGEKKKQIELTIRLRARSSRGTLTNQEMDEIKKFA